MAERDDDDLVARMARLERRLCLWQVASVVGLGAALAIGIVLARRPVAQPTALRFVSPVDPSYSTTIDADGIRVLGGKGDKQMSLKLEAAGMTVHGSGDRIEASLSAEVMSFGNDRTGLTSVRAGELSVEGKREDPLPPQAVTLSGSQGIVVRTMGTSSGSVALHAGEGGGYLELSNGGDTTAALKTDVDSAALELRSRAEGAGGQPAEARSARLIVLSPTHSPPGVPPRLEIQAERGLPIVVPPQPRQDTAPAPR